jgi:phosphoribosyl-AMP cyclohydrolase
MAGQISAEDAIRVALDLPVVPPGYREDMLRCLGLSDDGYIQSATQRLATGVVELCEARSSDLAHDVDPTILAQLADGTVGRYLRQVLHRAG